MNKKLIEIINKKLKNRGWVLNKTTKIKPFGYIGYMFTQYDTDDLTIEVDLKAKTPSELVKKIIKTYK